MKNIFLFTFLLLTFLSLNAQDEVSDNVPEQSTSLYFSGGISLVNSYKRGNLDEFWQFVNSDPASIPDQGSASFYYLNFGMESSINKSVIGAGAQVIMANSHAIWGTKIYFGGRNEVYFSPTFFNITMHYGYVVDNNKQLTLIAEPGLDLGFMTGKTSINNNVYEQSFMMGLGGHIAGGINFMFTKNIGLTARLGYRSMKINEVHEDTGSSTGYSSFYANGTNGETVKIDWSGIYFTTGINFSFEI